MTIPKPALNDLDNKLSKYLDYYDGFFVEAGANDGFKQSNTYYLENALGWKGILIEAIPDLYHRCKKERINSHVYNYALVSPDYVEKDILIHYADLMSTVDGALKDNERQQKHIRDGLEIQNIAGTYSIRVPVKTLEGVLDEIQPEKIDLLSLDVEGYEWNVLQGLNFTKYRPQFILVEGRFYEEVNELLGGHYDQIDQLSRLDYLYRVKPRSEFMTKSLLKDSGKTRSSEEVQVHLEISPTYKVTAIVSTFRAERFMKGLLDDLLGQTIAKDLEIIIIDAASDEHERAIVEQYQKDHTNIHYVRTGIRIGIYEAWNLGVKLAKGRYVTNANTDDRHRPDAFERMVEIFEKNPKTALVYADVAVTENENEVLETATVCGEFRWPDFDLRLLFQVCYVGPQPMWRRVLHERYGYFDPTMKAAGDYEFWLKICRYEQFVHLPEVLGLYLLSSSSVEHANQQLSDCESEESRAKYWTKEWGVRPAPKGNYFIPSVKDVAMQNSLSEKPLVSIIMPTFNRPTMLLLALQSILKQTYANWEVIVVNDGGISVETDISSLNHGGRVKYINAGKNRERSYARNLGLQLAKGKYISYLDDDDTFYPNHLETLVSYLEETNYKVAYTDSCRAYQVLEGKEYVTKQRDIPYSTDFDEHRLLVGNYIPILCLMHERACLDETGDFDESLQTHEDWDLWIRLSRKYPFAHLKIVTAEFSWRTDGSSTTSSHRDDFLRTTEHIYHKYQDYMERIPGLVPLQQRNLEQLRADDLPRSFTCSIIIPVCNRCDLTSQCLKALSEVTSDINYEVIVIDNASTDGTREFLSALVGHDVKVIRNDTNLGFAKACNQGARMAKGRYVVFLNNDTIPQEGWLSPLVEEVEQNADVAVVGSKLLFPDNTIQHAGVVFCRKDFMPYHIFNGAVENLPAANVRREFQAVTAACMLVKRESFEVVGGFDEGFLNGFEDVDFCLKIREGGEKVIYQPKSMLVHLEQQTPGRKNKEIEQKNYQRLRGRWKARVSPDEDLYYVSAGYKNRLYVEDGILRVSFTPFVDENEKVQWNNLEHVQRLLLQNQYRKEDGTSSQYESELRSLLSDVSQWPKDLEALRWAALICHKNKFHENEKGFWTQMLELDDDSEAREYLTSSSLKQNKLSDAKQHLQALLASNPKSGIAHFLQGVLFLQLTQYVPASEAFRLAAELGFDHLKVEKGLAMAYLGMGNAEESWRIYDKVLAYCPDDVEVINGLLQAGTALGWWEKLGEILTHYLERNPGNLNMRFALASVAYRAEQSDQAMQQLAFLKLMKPDYDGLLDLERLLAQEHSVHPVEGILENDSCDVKTKGWKQSRYPGIAYSDGEEIETHLKHFVETSTNVSVMSTELASPSHCREGDASVFNEKHRFGLPDRFRISVIVSTYASEAFIRECLEDLVRQTLFNQMEIIIVDSGSPEGEKLIIQEYQQRFSNIIYIRTSRETVYSAWNRAILLARGEYITPFSTNDRLRIDAYEILCGALDKYPDVVLVYGDTYLTQVPHETFEKHTRVGEWKWPDYNYEHFLQICLVGPHPMWRRNVHGQVGYFDEQFKALGDQEFWLRIGENFKLLHIPEFTGLYWVSPDSLSAQREIFEPELQKIRQMYFPKNNTGPRQSHEFSFDCSIIIPVFNRLELTQQCLRHLEEVPKEISYELVIVDNYSSDGTSKFLQTLGGDVQVIFNQENLGFAKACNQGALAARGKYLVFLKNDTIPQPGWLGSLIEEVESDENVAVVGSKLVFPDNTIQHAEVVFSRHLDRPYHACVGSPENIPVANVRKEIQAVTVDCMLVRNKIFDQVGRFDEVFGDEYVDIDLCLRIGQLGKKVVYQPKSCLYVVGSQISRNADYKSEHAERFLARWKSSLMFDKNFVAESNDYSLDVSGSPLVEGSVPQSKSQVEIQEVVSIVNDPRCAGIRILNPLKECFSKGWVKASVRTEAEGTLKGLPLGPGKVWVIHRNSRIDDEVIKQVRASRTRLVHDLDDLLWKIPNDNANKNFINSDKVRHLFKLLEQADCVTVSTEPLRMALEEKGINASILPNGLIAKDWEQCRPQRGSGRRPRVGWAGQVGVHSGDLAVLQDVFERLGEEVEWVFLGDSPRRPKYPRVFWECYPEVPLKKFPQALAALNLDLALAPLAVNEFNEAKSNLRILQYGMLEYPVIATAIYPHQQVPVTCVPNQSDAWVQAIRDHIYDLESAKVKGRTLYQWVLGNGLLEQFITRYRAAWLGEAEPMEAVVGALINDQSWSLSSPVYQSAEKTLFDCSIIIPVFNRVELTQQCLSHLAEVTKTVNYEVIVVDNASTDETPNFLSSLSGDCQVIRNKENLGFSKACNQGALVARGKHLVFLNNDTIPQFGWLGSLIEEVEFDENVAVVGSKLLFPDNTIQHAGVVFARHLDAPYHLFSRVPENFPPVNSRKEFQAVTAACMLVRKEIFERVGGFDEGFVNGYEDVDLCLKIRQLGKKVVYQPKSCLYHLEGQSPGRKKYDDENYLRLIARWKHQWLVDQDLMVYQSGYVIQNDVSEGELGVRFVPINEVSDSARWKRVVELQQILLGQECRQLAQVADNHKIRELLVDAEEWPSDPGILEWVGRVCETLQCEQEAVRFWKKLLTLGDHSSARLGLGRAMLKKGILDEAQNHLNVLKRDFNPGREGWMLQGILSMQWKNYLEAKQAFEQSLVFDTENIKARMGFGMACMGLEHMVEAWNAFEQVVSAQPDHAEAIRSLIQAGTALQRWEALAGHLSRFVERNPTDCDIRFALAGVLFRGGNSEKAKEHLSWLRLVNPSFQGLEDLERVLNPPQSESNLVSVA